MELNDEPSSELNSRTRRRRGIVAAFPPLESPVPGRCFLPLRFLRRPFLSSASSSSAAGRLPLPAPPPPPPPPSVPEEPPSPSPSSPSTRSAASVRTNSSRSSAVKCRLDCRPMVDTSSPRRSRPARCPAARALDQGRGVHVTHLGLVEVRE